MPTADCGHGNVGNRSLTAMRSRARFAAVPAATLVAAPVTTPKPVQRGRAPLRVAANGSAVRGLSDIVNRSVPSGCTKKFVRRRAACRNAKENWTTRAFGLIRAATGVAARYCPPADAPDLVLPAVGAPVSIDLPRSSQGRDLVYVKRARPSYARATPALKPSGWLPRFGYGTGVSLLKTMKRRTHYAHRRRFRRRSERTRSFSLAAALPRDRVFRPVLPLPGATTSNEFKTPQTTIRSGCIRHAAKAISHVSIPNVPAQFPEKFWVTRGFFHHSCGEKKPLDRESGTGVRCWCGAVLVGILHRIFPHSQAVGRLVL